MKGFLCKSKYCVSIFFHPTDVPTGDAILADTFAIFLGKHYEDVIILRYMLQ